MVTQNTKQHTLCSEVNQLLGEAPNRVFCGEDGTGFVQVAKLTEGRFSISHLDQLSGPSPRHLITNLEFASDGTPTDSVSTVWYGPNGQTNQGTSSVAVGLELLEMAKRWKYEHS